MIDISYSCSDLWTEELAGKFGLYEVTQLISVMMVTEVRIMLLENVVLFNCGTEFMQIENVQSQLLCIGTCDSSNSWCHHKTIKYFPLEEELGALISQVNFEICVFFIIAWMKKVEFLWGNQIKLY